MKDLEYVKLELLKIDNVDIKDSTFTRWSKFATFIDSEFGEWEAKVSNVVGKRKTNHPKRANLLRKIKNIETNSLSEVKDKRKATNISRYNHPTGHTSESLSKRRATMLDKYGYECALSLPNRINACNPQKTKATMLKRYGVDNPMKSKNISQKMVDTKIAKGLIKKVEGATVKELSRRLNIPRTTLNSLIKKYGPDLNKIQARYTSSVTDIEQILLDEGYTRCATTKYSYRPDFQVSDTLYLNADGLYWHSDKIKDKNYHFNLRKVFEDNGEHILQFRADEINNKINIINSMIQAKQGNFEQVIYGRKTKVKEVKEVRRFLDENHLMGYRDAKHVGLYFNDKLVCIMSYTVRSKILKIERFCSVLNTQVIGGFSKLLSYLEKKLELKKIHNWVDLRYGTGKHLENKGFTHSHDILSFKWTNNKVTYNRLMCKAKDGKTEKEVAKNMKLHKIYDAGQRLYIKVIDEN